MPIQYKTVWTEAAKLDLEQIVEYIFFENVSNAEKIYNKIKQKTQSLETLPFRGRIVPEFKNKLNVLDFRELIEQSWRLIYFVEGPDIVMAAIIDSRRNFEQIMLDRFKIVN